MNYYEDRSPRLLIKRWREGDKENAWYYTKRGNNNVPHKEEVERRPSGDIEIQRARVIGYAEVESHGHIQTGNKKEFKKLLENVKEHSQWFRTFADRLNEEESEAVREVLRNE